MGNLVNHIENKKSFNAILPRFFYSEETNNRILEIIQKDENSIWNGIRFDENSRYWMEMPVTENEDAAWHHLLENKVIETGKQEDFWQGFFYENFRTGRTNKGEKAFKAMLKLGIIDQSTLDTINALKNNAESRWICISRNPVDWLFCSTEQSFVSCLNLAGDYESAYYLSLPAMLCDPCRSLVFVTDKKWKRVDIKGFEFQRYKILQRCWGIFMSEIKGVQHLFLEKSYPAHKWDVSENIKPFASVKRHEDEMEGYFSPIFQLGKYENGEEACIYLDTYRIRYSEMSGYVQYHLEGYKAGDWHPKFNYEGGFENLSCFEDLLGGKICYNCDRRISDGEELSCDGEDYCEECFNELFFNCECCGYTRSNNDSIWIEGNREIVCSDCYERSYFTCEHCMDCYHDNDSVSYDNCNYCRECFGNNFYECEDCRATFPNDSRIQMDGGDLCPDCFNKRKEETEEEETEEIKEEIEDPYQKFPRERWFHPHPCADELQDILGDHNLLDLFFEMADQDRIKVPKHVNTPKELLKYSINGSKYNSEEIEPFRALYHIM